MVEEVRISNWKDHLTPADDGTFIFRHPVTDPRIGATYHYMGGEMNEERTCTVDNVRGDCIESSSKYIKTRRLYEKITLRDFDFEPLNEEQKGDDTPEQQAANMLARVFALVPLTDEIASSGETKTKSEVKQFIDSVEDEISGGAALAGGACNSFVESLAQLVDLVLGTWTQKITKTVSALLTFGLPLRIVFGVHLIPLIGRLSGEIALRVSTESFSTVQKTLKNICFTVLIAATIVALLVWYSDHSSGMTFQEIVRQETWWNWVTYPIRSSRGTKTCRSHLCPDGQKRKPETTICEDGTCTNDACCEEQTQEQKEEESTYQKMTNFVKNMDWISAFMKGIGSVATGYLFYTALVKSLPDLVRAFFIFVDGATSLDPNQYAKIVAATTIGGFAAYKIGTWIQEVNMTARLLDDQVNRSFRDKWCYPLRRFRTWKKPQHDIQKDLLINAIVKELDPPNGDVERSHYRIFEYKEGDQTFHMIALATDDELSDANSSTDVYCIDQYNAYFNEDKERFIRAYKKEDVKKWFSYTLDESPANYYAIQVDGKASILYKKIPVSSHDEKDSISREMTCIFDSHARYEKDIKTFEQITIPNLKKAYCFIHLKEACTDFILPPCITRIKAAQKIIYEGDKLLPEINIGISLGTSLTIEGSKLNECPTIEGSTCPTIEGRLSNKDLQVDTIGDKWSITIDKNLLTHGQHKITIMNTRSTAEEKAVDSSSDVLPEKEDEPVPYTTCVVVNVHDSTTAHVNVKDRTTFPSPLDTTDADYTRYKTALKILDRVEYDIMANNDLAMLKVHAWLIENIEMFNKEDALYTFLRAKKEGKSSYMASITAAKQAEKKKQQKTPQKKNYCNYINKYGGRGGLALVVAAILAAGGGGMMWAHYSTSGAARDFRVRDIPVTDDFCVPDPTATIPTCREQNATLSRADPVRLLNRNTGEVHVLPNLINSELAIKNSINDEELNQMLQKHTEPTPSTAQTSLEVEKWMEENGFTFSHLSEYGIFPPGMPPSSKWSAFWSAMNLWQRRDDYHEKWMEQVREMLQNKQRENNNQNRVLSLMAPGPEPTKDIFVGSQRAPITLEQLERMLDPETIEATLVEMFPKKLGPLLNRRMKPEYDSKYSVNVKGELKLLTGAPFKTIASLYQNNDIILVDDVKHQQTSVNLQNFIDEYTEEVPGPDIIITEEDPKPEDNVKNPDAATGWFNVRGEWRPY